MSYGAENFDAHTHTHGHTDAGNEGQKNTLLEHDVVKKDL